MNLVAGDIINCCIHCNLVEKVLKLDRNLNGVHLNSNHDLIYILILDEPPLNTDDISIPAELELYFGGAAPKFKS